MPCLRRNHGRQCLVRVIGKHRLWYTRPVLKYAYILPALIMVAHTAQATPCRQGLIIGLDVSGSVDDREYSLQTHGLATALASQPVQDAIFADPSSHVDITVFEWSGRYAQRVIVPWTPLHAPSDIFAVTQTIKSAQRGISDLTTAIGASMEFAQGLANERPDCWQMTYDISGDGKSNTGPQPQDIRDTVGDLIINALVIGAPSDQTGPQAETSAELSAYFRAYVISPDLGFIETADGFDTYADAMQRKLIKELQVLAIGALQDQ